jgi:two-component system, OmpR family, sensor histidine kinase CreC
MAFSPEGGTIRLGLSREGTNWRLRIGDEGPGIPDFAQGRIFERFYSLPRPDGARSSGIGLNFVREVMALHGGVASVGNGKPVGAEAILLLPAD